MGVKIDCDDVKALYLAREIIGIVDGLPLTDGKSVLCGMTVALSYYASQFSQHVKEKGSVEKDVLSKLASADKQEVTCFSKYINLPEEEK